ncbi:MAG: hypothetical protein LBB26_00495 [Puniceicoccales bacterium]|jgi:hypothetical protein|nr:hypothetical protein [Puniceicoccales bacterium]
MGMQFFDEFLKLVKALQILTCPSVLLPSMVPAPETGRPAMGENKPLTGKSLQWPSKLQEKCHLYAIKFTHLLRCDTGIRIKVDFKVFYPE